MCVSSVNNALTGVGPKAEVRCINVTRMRVFPRDVNRVRMVGVES